jgi:hypothetical protein
MSTLMDALPYLDASFALFKGEPGLRKSTQALSYPKPQYWFSFDSKMSSLLLPMMKWRIDPKQIQYDNYTNFSKMREKLTEFQVRCPFGTLVVDTLGSEADAINRETLRIKGGVTTKDGETRGKKVGGIPVNTMEDFNAEAAAFIEMIALLKDIWAYYKVNIVLISHILPTNPEDKDEFIARSRQLATGGRKISVKIPAYCGEVYHFNMKPTMSEGSPAGYELITRHTFSDFARTELNLPFKIEFGDEPLYDNWIKPAIEKLKKQIIASQSQEQTQESTTPTTTSTMSVK